MDALQQCMWPRMQVCQYVDDDDDADDDGDDDDDDDDTVADDASADAVHGLLFLFCLQFAIVGVIRLLLPAFAPG